MINGSGAECFGRMTSISVEKQRKIMLQSPNGKKTFGYDVKFEDILAENLRGFVKIVSEKNRIKDISITNEFSIESFWTKDLPIKLLKPLSLKVFYEEGRYIVEEDVFNIYAANQDFQKACLDFENHICHLYEEFVREDIKKLGSGGVSLRKLLQSYIGVNNVDL